MKKKRKSRLAIKFRKAKTSSPAVSEIIPEKATTRLDKESYISLYRKKPGLILTLAALLMLLLGFGLGFFCGSVLTSNASKIVGPADKQAPVSTTPAAVSKQETETGREVISGKITAITPLQIELQTETATYNISYNQTSVVLTATDTPLEIANLKTGNSVTVRFNRSTTGDLTAERIKLLN